MACFIAPASVAIIITTLRRKIPKNWHINWLNTMIWGGTVALAVEHVAHREIVPFPPFLTAMNSPIETIVMLKEMASVGIPMIFALIFAWIMMVVIYENFIATNKLSIPAHATTK